MRSLVSRTSRLSAALILLALLVPLYRQTIEAPTAIPEAILKHLDPYMGSDMGRIYRVVPVGFKQPQGLRLSRASLAYVVDTREGDSYTGIIVNETASSVTVRQPLGNEVVVPRSRIAKIQTQSTSLMPEGLEEGLTHQDLADLVEFIFADIH